MDEKAEKGYKLSLEIFDEVRESCFQQLNVAQHALNFYLTEKYEFLDTISHLADLLTINYRMNEEMKTLEQTSEIKDNFIYLSEDQISLLEATTLAKLYAMEELKKTCTVSVYYN